MAPVFQQSGSNIETSCLFQCFNFIRSLLSFVFFCFFVSVPVLALKTCNWWRHTDSTLRETTGLVPCSVVPELAILSYWSLCFVGDVLWRGLAGKWSEDRQTAWAYVVSVCFLPILQGCLWCCHESGIPRTQGLECGNEAQSSAGHTTE